MKFKNNSNNKKSKDLGLALFEKFTTWVSNSESTKSENIIKTVLLLFDLISYIVAMINCVNKFMEYLLKIFELF